MTDAPANNDHPGHPFGNLVHIRIPVAWGEMDAFGHVNNIVYFRYLESARIEFIRRCGWFAPEPGNAAEPPAGRYGVILHSVRARFRSPVKFPDHLVVSSRVVLLESDRVTLAHDIWSEQQKRIVAEGEGVIVAYDYERACKSVIPDGIAARIRMLQASGNAGGPGSVC